MIIPSINPIQNEIVQFSKWNKFEVITSYSILLLDISGSMINKYKELVNMANIIIENQMENPENKGTIIFFGSDAHLITTDYKILTLYDVTGVVDDGGTDFDKPFSLAVEYINISCNFQKKRLLFLTVCIANSNNLPSKCDLIANAGFSIYILGFGDSSNFMHLEGLKRGEGTFQSYKDFNDVSSAAIEIFAT